MDLKPKSKLQVHSIFTVLIGVGTFVLENSANSMPREAEMEHHIPENEIQEISAARHQQRIDLEAPPPSPASDLGVQPLGQAEGPNLPIIDPIAEITKREYQKEHNESTQYTQYAN